ncbi:class I SAM-dependent methyltransferase [Pedobacter sp. P351]|uniref:class I SAM-dependent methyltransferase n=1 Tax=Pedobacter superstes TaxID=3133441 RepID=UPI00309943AA
MKKSKDKFSAQAKQYQKFRPHYPDLLYSFLYSKVQDFDSAWDCGTGNGQVASELAEKFKKVFASDISENQLQHANLKDNITYFLGRSEETDFVDNSFDLITVAQAVHWFDLHSFYKEAKRVAKPNAVIAIWGYNLLNVSTEIDRIIGKFYNDTLHDYWDAERKLVEDEYKSISFPFKEFEVPRFEIVVNWDIEQLLGYLNSWSAVQNYIEANGYNPVDELENELEPFWHTDSIKNIRFRVFARVGMIEK